MKDNYAYALAKYSSINNFNSIILNKLQKNTDIHYDSTVVFFFFILRQV